MILEVTIIPYTLFLGMDFFNVPFLVGYYLRSMGLSYVLPFSVYVDFILVGFSEISPSKLNYLLS